MRSEQRSLAGRENEAHATVLSVPARGTMNDEFKCAGCILVVDDDPEIRRMITSYFMEHNLRAVAVPDRQELRRQLDGADINLIILDLRLGQEDGLDLLKEVRSHSDAPVIITTGHRRDETDPSAPRVIKTERGVATASLRRSSRSDRLRATVVTCFPLR